MFWLFFSKIRNFYSLFTKAGSTPPPCPAGAVTAENAPLKQPHTGLPAPIKKIPP